MKTRIRLEGYISFDIVSDSRLQHSSIRVYFHLIHLLLKNGDKHIYISLYNTLLESLQMSNNTLATALEQLKKFEYIFIKENGMREIIINGKGSFLKAKRKVHFPRNFPASFEPEKADATTPRAEPCKSEKKQSEQ